jgi:DNA-binding GntR family transcriptional regulator
MQTPLQVRLLEQLRLKLGGDFQSGDRINEAEVAEQLGVSRTPVRHVLQKLEAEGALQFEPRKGFVVKDPALLLQSGNSESDELLDERVMRDMATGELSSVFSERALMQRYSVPNGVLASTLRRLTRDHLVEPMPGRGWVFADVSPPAIADSYRFRQIIEPAGILADSYQMDAEALRDIDDEHVAAIKDVLQMDRRRLFDLDARFHSVVAQGAQTGELVSAIERQNNIRRVSEYIGFTRIDRLRQSMIEHRRIIAALLEGNRQVGASLMRIHLQMSMDETFIHMHDDLQLLREGKMRLAESEELTVAEDFSMQ